MILIAVILAILNVSSAFKILVFSPTTSRSHMISNGRIADTLAEAGHDVIMLEPDFLGIFHKVEAAKVAKRLPVYGFGNQMAKAMENFNHDVFEDESIYSLAVGFGAYTVAFNELCEDLINRDELLAELKAEKFDAFIGEQMNLCGNGLAQALDIRAHLWVSSMTICEPMAWIIGMPYPHSYIPASFGINMDTKPSYLERISNIAMGISQIIGMKYHNRQLNYIFRKKFGPDFPDVETIAGNSDLIFVATDEFIEFNRPIVPNVIHIGGLGLTETKTKLNKELEKEMEKGELGVIYFSLGTIVNTTIIPNFAIKTIMDTAKQYPKYHFIVKCDKYDTFAFSYASSIPNVYVTSWVPQPALLAHERLRIFITHAGYNGVMEAARAGVPLITMPFMFDQTRNSRAVASSGWGIALKRQYLRDKQELLREAIGEMLNNKRYKEKAVRISNLVRKKPFNATERLVKYTEFVLENNGIKELLVEGRNINIIKYYNIDIIVPAFVLGLLVIYIFIRILIAFVHFIFSTQTVKVKVN